MSWTCVAIVQRQRGRGGGGGEEERRKRKSGKEEVITNMAAEMVNVMHLMKASCDIWGVGECFSLKLGMAVWFEAQINFTQSAMLHLIYCRLGTYS